MIKSAAPTQQGFTLLEIMISLVLICLVIVSVIQLSSANLRNLATSDDYIEGLARANDKMRDVLELEKFEEKSWKETDNEGYVYDIAVAEIEKERTDALTVRFMQITVTVSHLRNRGAKTVALKTAKLTSKFDALKNDGKDAAPKGSVH